MHLLIHCLNYNFMTTPHNLRIIFSNVFPTKPSTTPSTSHDAPISCRTSKSDI